MPGLIAALDTTDPARARVLAHALSPRCGMLKVGLEFYLAHGPAGVCGTVDGLPYGLQLMAPAREDARLYSVGAAVEALLDERRGTPVWAQAPDLTQGAERAAAPTAGGQQ